MHSNIFPTGKHATTGEKLYTVKFVAVAAALFLKFH